MFTVTEVPAPTHPLAFLTLMLYVPSETFENIPVVLEYVIPSMLNVSPVLIVELTEIVPVATVHVGCITDAVGAPGIAG